MMTLPDITDAELIDALKAVVAESPDHVYTAPQHMLDEGYAKSTCFYVHTDENDETKLSPGCVVGAALHRLGVPLEALQEYEHQNANAVLNVLYPGLSIQAKSFAGRVQLEQDNKFPWGRALAIGLRHAQV
jgi:hypothetical protein